MPDSIKPKMFKLFISLLVTLFLIIIPIKGQDNYFRHYDTNNGLLTLKIFDLHHASDRIMWFATEVGLYSFDGYDFLSYENEESANGTILRLYPDFYDKIWYSTDENKIGFIEKGKPNSFLIGNDLVQIDSLFKKEIFGLIDNIFVDSVYNTWISLNNRTLFKIDTANEIIKISKPENNLTEDFNIRFFKVDGRYIWQWINHPITEKIRPQCIVSNSDLYLKFNTKQSFDNRTRLLQTGPDEFLFAYNFDLFHIKNDTIINTISFEQEIIDIYNDSNDSVNIQTWISLKEFGSKLFNNFNFEKEVLSLFQDKTISGVEKDFQGNTWFSTTDDGIYFSSNLAIKQYTFEGEQKNNYLTALNSKNNKVFIASLDGIIRTGTINNNSGLSFDIYNKKNTINNRVRYILEDHNGDLFLAENNLLKFDGTKFDTINYRDKAIYCHAITSLSNGSIVVSQINRILFYSGEKNNELEYEKEFSDRVQVLFEDNNQKLWVGASNGLFYMENDTIIEVQDTIFQEYHISDIEQTRDFHVIATRNNGIFISRDENKFTLISKNDEFKNKAITKLFIENDTCYWINSENSLSRLIFDNKNDTIITLNHFNYEDGLPSINITGIDKLGDLLILSTAKGLVSFNPKDLPITYESTRPEVIRLLLNEKEINFSDEIEIGPGVRRLKIEFGAIEYRHPDNIKYFYKLDSADINWNQTENRIISYPNLSPGTYYFKLKAVDFHGNENYLKEPFPDIIVNPAFFSSKLFYRLLIIFLIISAISIFFISYKTLKRREILKRQMLVTERKALLSQMNPHFIFNALNSIQHFFVQRNDKLAHSYLSNLSSLIRRILDFSKMTHILLVEEIETLSLYLELEKLRFEEKFNYTISIDENIDPAKIKIPPMLIQPCLENSILHGLLPKKGQGNLFLSINNFGENRIKCIIEDSGIGRKEALAITKRSSKQESMGINNIRERIKLINVLEKAKIKFIIEDLYSEEKASGTRVIIIIPY